MRYIATLLGAIGITLMLTGCTTGRIKTSEVQPRSLGQEFLIREPADSKERPEGSAILAVPENIKLRDALALALTRSPELKAYSYEVRAADARAIQAGLRPNPELEAEITDFDSAGTGFDTAETTIALGQLLELGGKRRKRAAASKLQSNLSKWDYESKRLDLFVETTHAFVDVLAAQKAFMLATDAVTLATTVNVTVGERVKAGKVSPLENNRAGVALSMSKMDLNRAKEEMDAARARLASVWGDSKPLFETVTGAFETVLASIPSIESLEADLETNPDLARWDAEMALRKATVAMERSMAIPDLHASAGVQQFESTGEDALTFGLAVTVPIFDRNQGSIQAARHELSKALEERNAANVRARRTLNETYKELTVSHLETVTLQSEILPAAQSAFESAQDGYQQGKFGYIEVLDAQRTMFDVRQQYVKSLSAYHKAVVSVERLIGRTIEQESGNEQNKGDDDDK